MFKKLALGISICSILFSMEGCLVYNSTDNTSNNSPGTPVPPTTPIPPVWIRDFAPSQTGNYWKYRINNIEIANACAVRTTEDTGTYSVLVTDNPLNAVTLRVRVNIVTKVTCANGIHNPTPTSTSTPWNLDTLINIPVAHDSLFMNSNLFPKIMLPFWRSHAIDSTSAASSCPNPDGGHFFCPNHFDRYASDTGLVKHIVDDEYNSNQHHTDLILFEKNVSNSP